MAWCIRRTWARLPAKWPWAWPSSIPTACGNARPPGINGDIPRFLAYGDRLTALAYEKGDGPFQVRPLLLGNEECPQLPAEHSQELFELHAHLLDDLLALAHVD